MQRLTLIRINPPLIRLPDYDDHHEDDHYDHDDDDDDDCDDNSIQRIATDASKSSGLTRL